MKKKVIFQWIEGPSVVREETMFIGKTEHDVDEHIKDYKKDLELKTGSIVNIYYPKMEQC